jgi:hypothetical protein
MFFNHPVFLLLRPEMSVCSSRSWSEIGHTEILLENLKLRGRVGEADEVGRAIKNLA